MTIVVSSGDGGVAYSQSHGCLVANGTLVFGNPSNSSFVAQFPASCPYVTAVGATQVTAGNSVRLSSLSQLRAQRAGSARASESS